MPGILTLLVSRECDMASVGTGKKLVLKNGIKLTSSSERKKE